MGVSYSGLKAYAKEGNGPLAGTEISIVATAFAHEGHQRSAGEEFWEEIHEFMANFTLLLVFIHLAGVAASSILHKENLVRAMVTGKKQWCEKDL